MASSPGTKRTSRKENEPEKTYIADDDSDDYMLDLSFLDSEPETFKPAANLCNDPFLNLLCDDSMFKGNEWFMDDEAEGVGEEPEEHGHYEDEDQVEIGAEFRVHDPTIKWNKMEPHVGELYESPSQLRFALTNYAVANGYQIHFVKSDRVRVIAHCGKANDKKPCPFRVYATWMYNERSFQIKNMCETHLCARNYKFGCLVNSNWLAIHYLKDIIRKPKMTLTQMVEDVLSKFRIEVSKGQCQRARVRAKELIEGKLEEYYAKVWDYASEIIRSNPGSTCQVGVTVNPDERNYFSRFYVCFKAMRDGWNAGCRRVIGLDGCFLKGHVKGELLTAIGRDANNQVFPIAWAVVNIENKDNWIWFLELLSTDLGLDNGRGLVVISDQHKGLVEAVKIILPNVEHRQCARHIFANFRKVFTGVEFKNLFWGAATSSVEGDFLKKMEDIKRISVKAYEWLMSKDPKSWCMAYFAEGAACAAVENGISESFNFMIIEFRKKPLLTMLEEIRIYLMDRFYHMAKEATTWNSEYCPVIIRKLNEIGEDMRQWKVIPSGGNVFETRHGYAAYKVDLDRHHCTCRYWILSGIPCVHAQSAISFIHLDPVDYINKWYSKTAFMAAYKTNILPLNGSNMWPRTDYHKPLPPLVRRLPGRPKTKRRRHVSERADSKYPTIKVKSCRSVRCGNCLELGHNKKSCTNPTKVKQHDPKNKLGRPKRGETITPIPSGEGTSRVINSVKRRKLSVKRGGMVGGRKLSSDEVQEDVAPSESVLDDVQEEVREVVQEEPAEDVTTVYESTLKDLAASGYSASEIKEAMTGLQVILDPVHEHIHDCGGDGSYGEDTGGDESGGDGSYHEEQAEKTSF